jgi:hypothetical protein
MRVERSDGLVVLTKKCKTFALVLNSGRDISLGSLMPFSVPNLCERDVG